MGRTSDARERLVASAKELLSDRGFNAVGVSDLCAHANVKKGSFYYFFPSKQDLAVAAIEACWNDYEAGVDRALARGGTALERLERLVRLHYNLNLCARRERGAMSGCMFGNLALELSNQDDVIRKKLEQTFRNWAARVAELVKEGMRSGEIPKSDARLRALELIAYVEGVLLLAKTNDDPSLIRKLEPGVRRLLG